MSEVWGRGKVWRQLNVFANFPAKDGRIERTK